MNNKGKQKLPNGLIRLINKEGDVYEGEVESDGIIYRYLKYRVPEYGSNKVLK